MRTVFYTFSFLLCTLLSAIYPPSAAAAEGSFSPGQVILYQGKARISQKVDDAKAEGDSFNCTLLAISDISAAGEKTILAVRELVPAAEGGSPVASYDILDIGGKPGLKARATAMELDAAHQMVGIYLPLRLEMPSIKIQEKPSYEVLILNQIPVKIRCARKVDGNVSSISNTQKASFDFRGSKATLNKWKESYTSDKKTGAVNRIGINYEMSVSINGNMITLSLDCDLEAKEITTLGKKPALRKGLVAFRAASAAFAAMSPSTATRPWVDETGKLLDKSPWSALARAARTQLQGFVETFESDDAGKVLARILGKMAPDFTLADLKGRQVNFRKETAGKVTLLSFWGYG